jgi:hypothetical protein
MNLTEILVDPERKKQVVADCGRVLEAEVASKRGFRGAALKTGYRGFKRVRPGMVAAAFDRLLPAFAPAIDPFYERGRASGDVHRYFEAQAGPIADALLSVTDAKADRAANRLLVRIYRSLRGPARAYVMGAAPRISEIIVRHDR